MHLGVSEALARSMGDDELFETVRSVHRECGPDCCVTMDRCEDEPYCAEYERRRHAGP